MDKCNVLAFSQFPRFYSLIIELPKLSTILFRYSVKDIFFIYLLPLLAIGSGNTSYYVFFLDLTPADFCFRGL